MKQKNDSNLKYISRCYYYGKLIDWDYTESGMMILKLCSYTATEHFGKSTNIRLLVPTDLEDRLKDNLIVGYDYFVIAAPYKLSFNKQFRHRVDLLLNIFQEV